MADMDDLFQALMHAHPRIQERGLEARLVAVLNDAYAFEVARGLEALDLEAELDALETLLAAVELASTVTRFRESDRGSGIRNVMHSLVPPPSAKNDP
jgi:hypothetical protein